MSDNIPPFQGSKPFADGWFWEGEGATYRGLAERVVGGNILEIGSFDGLSLSYIKDTIRPNGNSIFSVEINCRERLIRNTQEWGIKLICKHSMAAARDFPDRFFDLIYIDADHSYDSTRRDILTWLPKLRKRGVIAGHDYDMHWPGVVRAVDEIFGSSIEVVGRSWIVYPRIKLI